MNPSSKDDWRLRGQEKFLKDVELVRQRYCRDATNPKWDHDHCEFCGAKFMTEEFPNVLHEGYVTKAGRRWVCDSCFSDFNATFGWTVTDDRA